MHTLTQLLIGMAAAGVVAGPQRPVALVVGAVAGVLPDVIDWWARHLFRQPEITVTPDPLAPTPATMAQGVRLALQQVRIHGRPIVVRLNPLPDPNDGYVPYCLDCDHQHRLVVAMDTRSQPHLIDLSGADSSSIRCFAPLHPLPLRIVDMPVDVQFQEDGKRIQGLDLARVAGVGHAWPVAGVLAGGACLCNFWLGLAAAAALAAHLFLETSGRRESLPGWPFSRRLYHGRRLWDEEGWRDNLCASAIASAVIAAVVLAGG